MMPPITSTATLSTKTPDREHLSHRAIVGPVPDAASRSTSSRFPCTNRCTTGHGSPDLRDLRDPRVHAVPA